MADELNNGLDPVTGLPKEPAGDSSAPPSPPAEPQVPLSRLREVIDEVRDLKKKLEEKAPVPPASVPDDEKRILEVLSKREMEAKEQEERDDKELRKELDDLHLVHGEFDEDKLLNIIEEYGLYNEDNTVRFDKAIELLDRLNANPEYKPKVKLPNGSRAINPPEVAPSVELKGKTLFELAQEGLKKFGIK